MIVAFSWLLLFGLGFVLELNLSLLVPLHGNRIILRENYFSIYEELLKLTNSSITTIMESSIAISCLVSSSIVFSSKLIIGSDIKNHTIDNSNCCDNNPFIIKVKYKILL